MNQHAKNEKFVELSQNINKYIKHLQDKDKAINKELMKICKEAGIDEPTLGSKIAQLLKQQESIRHLRKNRIKSKIQTYDIRDCEEYYGILQLE